MNKKVRYVMYVVTIIICIASLVVGVYSLRKKEAEQQNKINENIIAGGANKTIEKTTLEKFKDMFTNQLVGSVPNENTISKIDGTKPIVYEESQTIAQEGKYSVDAHLPIININSELAQKYNTLTMQNFASKVNTLMSSSQETAKYTIYDTSYTCFVNNNILSIAIMASLKEGNDAQRVIVKTYNYNLQTNQEVTIEQIIQSRGLDTTAVNKKINKEIKKIAEDSISVSKTGYDVFTRDVQSDMYDIKNTKNFIQGENGELYIIYSYGDTHNTSEMDVIQI